MFNALIHFSTYTAEVIITVIAILLLFAGIVAIATKSKMKSKKGITVKKLNQHYKKLAETINEVILSKKEKKKKAKEEKARNKKHKDEKRKKVFVLTFIGDMKASTVNLLREEITAILNVATPQDEVVLRLESGGGVIHGYGLAASELQRIKNRNIPLTVIVDKIAASGGYMMACVANQLLAAPFSIIGSIGVIAQLPNFNRLLKKHDIEFEQISGGKYKRTLTMFGENTREGRKKFQEDVNEAHYLFKDFVKQQRPQIDIEKVSTGEYWLGTRALELQLIDKITTSDDYLLSLSNSADLYEIHFAEKKNLLKKLGATTQSACHGIISGIQQSAADENYYL